MSGILDLPDDIDQRLIHLWSLAAHHCPVRLASHPGKWMRSASLPLPLTGC